MQDQYRESDRSDITLPKVLGWGLLGGAAAPVLFFWSILGIGAAFGGTEVGDGRVPGVGILWLVFFYAVIPVSICGALAAAIWACKQPLFAPVILKRLGVIAAIGAIVFFVLLIQDM